MVVIVVATPTFLENLTALLIFVALETLNPKPETLLGVPY